MEYYIDLEGFYTSPEPQTDLKEEFIFDYEAGWQVVDVYNIPSENIFSHTTNKYLHYKVGSAQIDCEEQGFEKDSITVQYPFTTKQAPIILDAFFDPNYEYDSIQFFLNTRDRGGQFKLNEPLSLEQTKKVIHRKIPMRFNNTHSNLEFNPDAVSMGDPRQSSAFHTRGFQSTARTAARNRISIESYKSALIESLNNPTPMPFDRSYLVSNYMNIGTYYTNQYQHKDFSNILTVASSHSHIFESSDPEMVLTELYHTEKYFPNTYELGFNDNKQYSFLPEVESIEIIQVDDNNKDPESSRFVTKDGESYFEAATQNFFNSAAHHEQETPSLFPVKDDFFEVHMKIKFKGFDQPKEMIHTFNIAPMSK